MFYLPGFLKAADGHWLARSARRKLIALRQSWWPDLLDAHFGYPDGVGSVQLAQSLGMPSFVTVRGSETVSLRIPGVRERLMHALSTATGCICVSHSLARLLTEEGIPAARIRVIHNAVDRELFRPGSRDEARRILGISERVRVIVSVGHLISGKRHHVLVRAVARLRARLGDTRLVIIGGAAYERDYPAKLERVVREGGLGEAVTMLGRLPQRLVSTWLQAADVFALATEREGCCNAVLEALAAGCPVITTPVGDNPFFIQESVNGALVPVDDVAALERALTSALSRTWDPSAISQSLGVGSWDDVAQRVLAFFAERLEGA